MRAEEPIALRYDLRPGDHLVYHEQLERRAHTTDLAQHDVSFTLRVAWITHVLVTGEAAGSWRIGIQRNLTRLEASDYIIDGQKQDDAARAGLVERYRQRVPDAFAEANWFTPWGETRLALSAVREFPSTLLPVLRELPLLPTAHIQPGDSWEENSTWYSLSFRAAGWDLLRNERCLRLEGTNQPWDFHLRTWFCPASGTVARVEFEGGNDLFALLDSSERTSWELVERRRGENLKDWLADPALQRGALKSLLASESIPLGPDDLYPLLASASAAVQRDVLTLAYRHHWRTPSHATLESLLTGDDVRVRALVVRLLEATEKDEARLLVEKALTDSDWFVREAALDWVRARLPVEQAATIAEPSDVRSAWSNLSSLPLVATEAPRWAALARSVRHGGIRKDWDCREASDWVENVERAQQFSPYLPGFSVMAMTTPPFAGIPYAVYIPEDYRGDRPFPLLVYLSGSGGRSLEGALSAAPTLSRLGYLVIVPEAQNQMWWTEGPTRMMAALLPEVLHTFNVDTNRVYLAGFSNGGTGTVYYAGLWTDRFAAAAPLMGAGMRLFAEPRPLVANLTRLPLLFVHGTKDPTIPPAASQEMVKALHKLASSAPVELHLLKGRGHDVLLGRDDGLTVPFLEKHRRDPFPRRVRFYTASLTYPRSYWVQILAKDEGIAGVEATIKNDNTIRVDTRNVKRVRLLLRRELLPRSGPVRVLLNRKKVFEGELTADCALLQKSWQETGDPFLAYSTELDLTVPQ